MNRRKNRPLNIGCRVSEKEFNNLREEFGIKNEFINFSEFLRWKLLKQDIGV